MGKLAIVIPAFKPNFLQQSLESIVNQTNTDFVVYIGDDNSPFDLLKIIRPFNNKMEINYYRFEANLGSVDLVSQWNRCIELTNDEEWIWLFSDDDIMQSNCIDKFFEILRKTNNFFDIYRFNTKRIDHLDFDLKIETKNPIIESSTSFLIRKLKRQTNSYAVEFIFRKSSFIRLNGFVKFPAAWASDDATWALIGKDKGIYTIPDSHVLWRISDQNISNKQDFNISCQKLEAVIQYINWCKKNFKNSISDYLLLDWAVFQFTLVRGINHSQIVTLLTRVYFQTPICLLSIFIYYLIRLLIIFKALLRKSI
jgi:GT2 family glycosyltransferase